MSNELIAGFRMSGEYVKTLKETKFEVINAENQEIINPLKPEEKPKTKTVLGIKIGDDVLEWFPNWTSLRYIAKKQGGFKCSDLVGYKGELITLKQKIGPELRDVVYVKGSIQL